MKFSKILLLAFTLMISIFLLLGCSNDRITDPFDDFDQTTQSNLKLTELKDTSMQFTIVNEHIDESEESLTYEVVKDQSIIKEGSITNHIENSITVDNLIEDTSYQLILYGKENNTIKDKICFRTFANISQGYQLFYLIDAENPTDHNLNIQIFGYINRIQNLELISKGYHTVHGIKIIEESLQASQGSAVDENEPRVSINNEGFFQTSYQVDKSYFDTGDHGAQGYLGKDYLMISGEQALLVPENYIDDQINYIDTIEIKGFLNAPESWSKNIGFEQNKGIINFMSHLKGHRDEGIRASNIYGFNPDKFRVKSKTIANTSVKIIMENSLDSDYVNDIFDIYNKMSDKWGGGVGDQNYTIMITDANRFKEQGSWGAYAGEWTTGQGFSATENPYSITGEMIAHQMYHRWNAWERGIGWNFHNSDYNWGFWNEGFNEYYDDKVRTELNIINHDDLKGYYNWYKSIKNTNQDTPIFEYDYREDDWRIIYHKGALLAYLLDKKIQNSTNNDYSLDDVLQFAWQRWEEDNKKFDYDIMFDFIENDLGVSSINEWKSQLLHLNQSKDLDGA